MDKSESEKIPGGPILKDLHKIVRFTPRSLTVSP